MAFDRQKINPLDLVDSQGVGVALPFEADSVFTQTYTTREAFKTNLINYFLTGRGERYLNPNFGSPLRPLLFDQMTEDRVANIRTVVERDLGIYFPSIVIKDILVEGDPSRNIVQFALRYGIADTPVEDEVTIDFEL
jgi:phage baseplate assembly protein W